MMAPTEVLAEQHFIGMLEQLGCQHALSVHGPVYESSLHRVERRNRNLRVGLLTGSLTPRERRTIHAVCADGEVDLVVGNSCVAVGRGLISTTWRWWLWMSSSVSGRSSARF